MVEIDLPDREPDPEAVAQEFARKMEVRRQKQVHQERMREIEGRTREDDNRTSRVLAMVWGPVVAVVLIGLLVMITLVVRQISYEHSKRVTVWCYADPNSDNSTSQFSGSRGDVQGICPHGG